MVTKDDISGDRVALQRFTPLFLISNTPKGMWHSNFASHSSHD